MQEDEWTVVGRKGRCRKRAVSVPERSLPPQDPSHLHSTSPETSSSYLSRTACLAATRKLTDALESSSFVSSLRDAVNSLDGPECQRCASVRCYGLGSPTGSLTARVQLALVPVFLDLLPAVQTVSFYDPVFTDEDTQVLAGLGYSVLSEEDACRHTVSEPAFFYMPHCDASLYNDVLDANWSRDISNVVILGNSFENMQERWTGHSFRRRPDKPHRVLCLSEHNIVREQQLLGTSFKIQNAFNDTSLHTFPNNRLEAASEIFLHETVSDSLREDQRAGM